MKKYFLAFTFAFTVVSFVLGGFFARKAGNDGMASYWTDIVKDVTKQTMQRSVAIRLDASKITELRLSAVNNDLRVETSPDKELHLLFTANDGAEVFNESDILHEVSGGVYEIDLSKLQVADKDVRVSFVNSLNFNVTVNDAEVIVQIPKNVKKIKTSSVSGDTKVGIDAEELSAEAVSGEIKVHGRIGKIYAKTISGDTRISLNAPAPQAQLDTVSGNVKVLVASAPDFVVDFETMSGEMGFDNEISETHFDGSSSGFKLGNGSGKVSIKTVSGDAWVSKETATE